MNDLILELKENGQDFEFYPTTKEIVKAIWEHRRGEYTTKSLADVLDIGCGTCNFRRWIEELNKALEKNHGDYIDRDKCVNISTYYVMEKSRILLDRLDKDVICLGTDFHQSTLIDKPVDTIFCNPPYSEFEDWTARIITESVCKSIYLVIPQRWKDSEKIKLALKRIRHWKNEDSDDEVIKVLGSFDFLDAERAARAKVDVLFINKEYTNKDDAFDHFFDEVFKMKDEKTHKYDFEETAAKSERLKTELLSGKNKVEILCNGYDEAQKTLFEHFQLICSLDAEILNTIGIKKENVKEALKKQFEGLKNLYWKAAFDCLDEITSRLTSQSREKLLNRFTLVKKVDFTASNIYALIIWVIKNANGYYKDQMIDFFKALSAPENIKNYKSNQNVFERDRWGYNRKEHDRYTLDYRIVCTEYALPGDRACSWQKSVENTFKVKISDVCTVANNLGFKTGDIDLPPEYGKMGEVRMADGTLLFTFRPYQNGNVHIKFNKEFIKALNVEVSRELGWIHRKEDIAKEFTEEMAEGAEKYFRVNYSALTTTTNLLGA